MLTASMVESSASEGSAGPDPPSSSRRATAPGSPRGTGSAPHGLTGTEVVPSDPAPHGVAPTVAPTSMVGGEPAAMLQSSLLA